jgi:hypothetical protein
VSNDSLIILARTCISKGLPKNNRPGSLEKSLPAMSALYPLMKMILIPGDSGGMKLIFFRRFDPHVFFGGVSSNPSPRKVILQFAGFSSR